MMQFSKALVVAMGLAFAAPVQVAAQDPTFDFAETDPAMSGAIAEARATLPLFLDHALNAKGASVPEAMIKVGLPTQSGSVEHIWIAPFSRKEDGSFVGYLANEPANLGKLRQGDAVGFTADMVSDWHLFTETGTAWGSFTSRVMFDAGLFGDTPFEQVFEKNPVPADWR